jgi:phage baseplate assembly protein W
MAIVNQPPTVTGAAGALTFVFPFQAGASGFPAMADPVVAVYQSIQSLMLTGVNERVMHPDMGLTVYNLVFENLTPILQAQIAVEVTRLIETYEPRAEVVAVDSRMGEAVDGGQGTMIIVDILYRVAGQLVNQQVPIPLGGTP